MAIYVSNDDGHSTNKTTYLNDAGELVKSNLLSRATIGNTTLSDSDGNRTDCYYTVDGIGYTIVDDASGNSSGIQILQTQTVDYMYSDHNLAINHHALHSAGLDNEEIILISSLPFSRYYSQGAKNERLISKKKNNLLRTNIEPLRNKIIEHYIMAEGVSGYFDLLYNLDGSVNQKIKELNEDKLIAVCDLGGATLDLTVFNTGKIDFSRSGSLDKGSLHLKHKVKDLVGARGFSSVSDNVLERIVREHKLSNGTDFTDEVNKCKKELSIEMENFINSRVGNVSDIGLVYFIGGTSLLLEQQLSNIYDKDILVFSQDPLFATSIGQLKYLLRAKSNG